MKRNWESELGKLKICKDAKKVVQKVIPKFKVYSDSTRGEISFGNFKWE